MDKKNFIKYPVGTKIVSIRGEMDHGAMTWDANDFEVERKTGPNAVGYIEDRDLHEEGYSHSVIFPDSEVCVNIYGEELNEVIFYEVRELGDGTKPVSKTPNYYCDPEVLKQIKLKEEMEGSQVKEFEVETVVQITLKMTVPALNKNSAKVAVENQYFFSVRESVQAGLFDGVDSIKAIDAKNMEE